MYIYPYKFGSKSARALGHVIGAKRIRHKNSKFRPRAGRRVINWGASELPAAVRQCEVINNSENVKLVTNKLDFMWAMSEAGVSTPDFTTDRACAQSWLEEGHTVMERTLLRASGGRGIIVRQDAAFDSLGNAPLYVKYQKAKSEWRVHILGSEVGAVHRKVCRNPQDPDVNWYIRSHENGFFFQRNNDNVPGCVIEEAMVAVHKAGLVFGAVDVLYNEHHDKSYVLEINTAPGLEGETLQVYADFFTNY